MVVQGYGSSPPFLVAVSARSTKRRLDPPARPPLLDAPLAKGVEGEWSSDDFFFRVRSNKGTSMCEGGVRGGIWD